MNGIKLTVFSLALFVFASGFFMHNASADQVVNTIQLGTVGGPIGPVNVSVDSSANMIYVGQQGSGTVNALYVINGTSYTVSVLTIGPTSTPPTTMPVVNPNTHMVYVLDDGGQGSEVTVINGTSEQIVTHIPVGSISGIAVNPSTDRIYTSGGSISGGSNVMVIDGATNQVISTIPVSGVVVDLAVNQATNKIYAGLSGSAGGLAEINGATNSFVKKTPGNLGLVSSVAVNPVTNKVYVTSSDCCHSFLNIYDGSTLGLLNTLQKLNSYEIAVNPSMNEIYLANDTNNTVVAVDGSNDNVLESINDGCSSVGLYAAADPIANKVYVVNPACSTVSVIGEPSTGTGLALNRVQTTSGNVTSSPYQITIPNFNAGTGSNQLLLVGVQANNNYATSVTFNGVPLAKRVQSFYNNDAEFWRITNATGTGDIVVTMNGPTSVVVGAYSFSGVNQTSPLPTAVKHYNTNLSSPNISITTKFPNDWVLDLPSIWGGVNLDSPTCAEQWDVNMPNQITGASSSEVVPSPDTVTCSWTASSPDQWDDVSVEIHSLAASH